MNKKLTAIQREFLDYLPSYLFTTPNRFTKNTIKSLMDRGLVIVEGETLNKRYALTPEGLKQKLTTQQITLLKALHVAATFEWSIQKGEGDVFDLSFYGIKPPELSDDITGLTWGMVYELIEAEWIDGDVTLEDDWGPCQRYFSITKRGHQFVNQLYIETLLGGGDNE